MEVCTSGVGGGGEGLFAKRQLEEGELVAIYNGVKVPIVAGAGKEDWEECGYSIGYYETSNSEQGWGDMDIPKAFRSSDCYRWQPLISFQLIFVPPSPAGPPCVTSSTTVSRTTVNSRTSSTPSMDTSHVQSLQKGSASCSYQPEFSSSFQVEAGCELFVHYQYLLSDCPRWYEELYNQL